MSPAPFEEAVTAMTLPENRFDVTVICTTDDHQAAFWMSKLNTSDGAASLFPLVIAVSEDWSAGGAGNGLGTLYAWKKAVAYAKENCAGSPDLEDLLGKGEISAALYHTAGKGTRMAPLPASENNNKPGVVRFSNRTKSTKTDDPCNAVVWSFLLLECLWNCDRILLHHENTINQLV